MTILPDKILVNTALLNRIAQYLARQPWEEVSLMMHEIMNLKPEPEAKAEPEVVDEGKK